MTSWARNDKSDTIVSKQMKKRIYPIARVIFFPILRFFTKRTVGIENLPKKGPFIIACKHIGSLDGFFLGAVVVPHLNRKVHFIASVKRWGYIWETLIAQKWAGVIQLFSEDRGRCLVDSRKYLENGEILGLFPEGYLDEYKRNSRGKTGAARLALWTKVPIIPVGLKYDITVENRVPVLYQFWKAVRNAFKNPHSMVFTFGKPFELTEYYDKDITENVLRESTKKIINKIEALTDVHNINK